MAKFFNTTFLVLCLQVAFAQSFLNGSFETNTAGVDQLNLQNAQYNSFMSNSVAFGDWNGGGPAGGNIDIIGSAGYCGSAQCGNWFIALTSGGTDAVSLTLTSPLVAGNTYTMSFYDRSCTPFPAGEAVEIGVSNVANAFGTLMYTAPAPVYDGGWTQRLFSFTAPISALYVTIRCSGPNNQLPWTEVDNFTISSSCVDNLNLGNDTTLCAGGSMLLNAASACATYLWQDGSTNPTLTVTQQGTYWVRVSQGACTFRDTINVSFISAQSLNLGRDTSLCSGETLLLNMSIPGATYQWQNGSSNATFLVTQAGSYWVSVTANGCSSADTINVAFNPAPVVNLGKDTILCTGESMVLSAFNNSSSYLWQDASNNATYSVTQPGIYWVRVTTNKCVARDTINVSYSSSQLVDLGNDTVLCQGNTLLLDASVNGANYQWQNGTTNSTFPVTQAGNYWVNIMASGCSSSDTINVAINPAPVVNLGNDTILCTGQSIVLSAFNNSSSYLWQDGSSNATHSVTQQGIYWVSVSMNQCVASDTISISYNSSQWVDLGNDTVLCQGNALLLDASLNGATYQWQDGSTNASTTATQQGLFWVRVFLNNCSSADSINVTFSLIPSFSLGNDTVMCSGEILTLSPAIAGANYQWQDGLTDSFFIVTQPGTFWVMVSQNNCTRSDSLNVGYSELPVLNLGNDTSICAGNNLVLNATIPSSTYMWEDGSTESQHIATDEGIYYVEVTTGCGIASDSIEIIFINCDCEFFVPSAFSPNHDGLNEIFKPRSDCGISDYEMKIFNRWGEMIFKTKQFITGWDGTFKGKRSPADVYVYMIRYRTENGNRIMKSGNVSLLR